jgi:hypothetical protein
VRDVICIASFVSRFRIFHTVLQHPIDRKVRNIRLSINKVPYFFLSDASTTISILRYVAEQNVLFFNMGAHIKKQDMQVILINIENSL